MHLECTARHLASKNHEENVKINAAIIMQSSLALKLFEEKVLENTMWIVTS